MENIRGAALMVLAMGMFASEDVLVKIVTERVPLGVVLVVLGGVGAAIFAIMSAVRGQSVFTRRFFHPIILIRNLGELVGTTCFVLGLTLVPLGLLSALLQANPLFVNIGAILFLGMTVGWRRWVAIAVGLVGVVIILRPGAEAFRPEALLGLGAAIGLAVRDVATRITPKDIHPLQTSSWGFFMGMIAGAVLLLFEAPILPGASDAGLMLGATALGMMGYYALTRAMQTGDVPAVTPFRYTRLVYAIIFALVFFDEVPDLWTLVGAALIVAAGLYTIIREARVSRAARRAKPVASPVRPS
ncbi:DMT family transporter [Maritimibacter sp. UBA3975]|uniref:DMT family transporter n=1 Tax=Maritimibacter sp. UBA3975 TaxID=1946833 RepID=UPI0025C16BD7|nr:DMT family transporter [Maritimibacter sp. UBA3975]|tara:strand:- start:1246 stop:2148 length:903 start_codon:yes stop_codon:yes gene_type:complete